MTGKELKKLKINYLRHFLTWSNNHPNATRNDVDEYNEFMSNVSIDTDIAEKVLKREPTSDELDLIWETVLPQVIETLFGKKGILCCTKNKFEPENVGSKYLYKVTLYKDGKMKEYYVLCYDEEESIKLIKGFLKYYKYKIIKSEKIARSPDYQPDNSIIIYHDASYIIDDTMVKSVGDKK